MHITNMEIDPNRLERDELKKMKKQEKKEYFRKRKSDILQRSKNKDNKNEKILRNIGIERKEIVVTDEDKKKKKKIKKQVVIFTKPSLHKLTI